MINSKLPDVGTTIFTSMSKLASETNAINLSQGFPDFQCHPYLKERVDHYVRNDLNQYAPMSGLPALCDQIARKTAQHYQRAIDSMSEVTVTSGATEALFAAINAVVNVGDEAIVFDPAYDSYDPAIRLAGGRAVHIPLNNKFEIDFQRLDESINSRTKLIIINSPHNPTGSVLTQEQMELLQQRVLKHNLILISDEVYEHIIFDGLQHQSVNLYPDLAERSFIISSFGKTLHTTGWKVGYCIAPQNLTVEFRKIHQYLTFCTSTPLQAAIADMLEVHPEAWQQLPEFYQQKRDHLRKALEPSRLELLDCSGTYFQLVNYSAVSKLSELEFAQWLTQHHGVAVIPISVFYSEEKQQSLARLCFAKNEETLTKSAERLCQL
ncbi:MAG: aminotransferase class I/II-fold pyridoxal phosphate-dependent enzyme [Gammaproteobacteria bacterium]|nr:aminotransferase class I/II-fold pyridoxal phosphate-dependent enzyme [Gammaproteobacteria bacterium]